MAKTWLIFVENDYDKDRYQRTLVIAEALAGLTIDAEFTPERPYLPDLGIPTPKIGCSIAAFDGSGQVALIQRSDNKRWAIPARMAEIGSPPSENALRELHEETGFEAEIERLVGIYDNKRFASVSPYQFYLCPFRRRITGGAPTTSKETLEVRLVDPADPPSDMSELQRTMLRDATSPPRSAVFQ